MRMGSYGSVSKTRMVLALAAEPYLRSCIKTKEVSKKRMREPIDEQIVPKRRAMGETKDVITAAVVPPLMPETSGDNNNNEEPETGYPDGNGDNDTQTEEDPDSEQTPRGPDGDDSQAGEDSDNEQTPEKTALSVLEDGYLLIPGFLSRKEIEIPSSQRMAGVVQAGLIGLEWFIHHSDCGGMWSEGQVVDIAKMLEKLVPFVSHTLVNEDDLLNLKSVLEFFQESAKEGHWIKLC